jgi:hypothetical protein
VLKVVVPPPVLSQTPADLSWARSINNIGYEPISFIPVFAGGGTLTLTSQTVEKAYYAVINSMIFGWFDVAIVTNTGSGSLYFPSPVPDLPLVISADINQTVVGGAQEFGITQMTTTSNNVICYRAAAVAFGAGQSVVIRSKFIYLAKRNNPGVFT